MPVDPDVLRRYEKLDDEGKRRVHEIGDIVLGASAHNYREGQLRMRERVVAILGPVAGPCGCRNLSHGHDSRSAGQEHWGDCLRNLLDRVCALETEEL